MSSAFCILNVPKEVVIKVVIESGKFMVEREDKGLIKILLNRSSDESKYSIKKRVALSGFVGKAPDDLQRAHAVSSVYLDSQALDKDNTHFQGFTVSLSDPEVVLDRISELLSEQGFDPVVLSEYDEEYQELFLGDIGEDDLPS